MKYILSVILIFVCFHTNSQNLAPNPDFEDYGNCPYGLGDFYVFDWADPPVSSSDYLHVCGGTNAGIPNNLMGNQEAFSGDGYVGIVTYGLWGNPPTDYREYIRGALSTATIAGECYRLTVIYSPAEAAGYSDGLGLLLTNGIPSVYMGSTPQMQKTTAVEDTLLWHTMSMDYISVGGETHVTVGNFNNNAMTTFVPSPSGFTGLAYYYIDSVGVEYLGTPATELNLDIGEDVSICSDDFPYTITSNLPNAQNIWNTGEIGESIEVNSPGLYYVVANDACSSDSDSILISLTPEPMVNVEDSTLCAGMNWTITLDPDLGEYTWNDEDVGNEFTMTESGLYEVSLENDCGIDTDEFNALFLPEINIPIQDNLELCSTEIPYVVDFSDFDDGNTTFLWLDGTDEPSTTIITTGIFGVEISNDCYSDFVSFEVDISSQFPSFYNFTDTLLCENESILINPGFIDVQYEWQNGSIDPYFIVTEPGDYAVTISNYCGVVEFDFEINLATDPTLELGSDVDICPGDSVYLSGPVGSEVIWNTGEQSQGIWVKDAGEIVGMVDGECSSVSDTIQVSFNGVAPQINLPDSIVICAGDTIALEASENDLGVDFIWNTGDETSIINVFSEGVYSVIASNNCGVSSDSIVILLGESLPDPDLLPLYTICSGDSIMLSIEPAGNDIQWSTGSQDSSINLWQEGTYFVSITNSCKTKLDSFEISFIQELSSFTLSADNGICDGNTTEIIAPILDGIYEWNTGDETNSLLVNAPGIYWLSIMGTCNTILDSIEILDLGTLPDIDLGPDVSFCDGDSVVLSAEQGDINSVIWSDGTMDSELVVTTAGLYTVYGTNECGSTSDTILISINNEVPQIDLGEDQEICFGDSLILDLGTVAGEISWNTGDMGTEIVVDEPGMYIATLSSSCGISVDTFILDILFAPEPVSLDDDLSLCAGDVHEINLDIPVNMDVIWSTGSMENSETFTESGTYWVVVGNTCGEVSDTLEVELVPFLDPVILSEDMILCDETSYEINGGISQADVDLLWNTDEITNTIIVQESGIYWLQISNACFVQNDSIELNFEDSPLAFDLGMDDTICAGNSIILDAFQGNNVNYLWQDNSMESLYEVTESGLYSLEIETVCGLESDEINITVLDVENIEIPLVDDYVNCLNESLLIDLSQIVADQIIWADGSNEIIRSLTNPGTYTIQFLNACTDTTFSFVFEQENCMDGSVYIPNTFTPNNDGINDVFQFNISENWEILSFEVSIYSRWGEQVFFSEDPDFSWDGRLQNKSLNPGVFAYYTKIEARIDDQVRTIMNSGDITIVK